MCIRDRGVVKRMLIYFKKGPSVCRLSNQIITQIAQKLVSYNGRMPTEFNRQPRSLEDLCYWKATEFQQFLLYHGPIVLKGIISSPAYEHFLSLHVAISMLLKKGVHENLDLVSYVRGLLVSLVCKYFS